jgi:hypothetical protein
MSVGGVPSPVPAAAVRGGGFALDLAFDEDMDPTRAGVSLSYGNERLEARYGSWQLQNVLVGGGSATYVLNGCPDLRVGDVVTVRDVQPRELEVVRTTVTAVNTGGSCSFTVASAATAAYQGGGWAAVPQGNGARPRWTGPRTLAVVFEPWVSLAPGSDSALEVWDVNDLSGNWPRDARTSLQVRELPGTDTTPPALLTSLPRQGGTAPGARMAILRFTKPLDRSTLAGITAQSSSGAVPYGIEYQNEEFGPMVFVTPRRAAPDGATVTVHVPGTVKDLAGNAMGSAVDLSYTVSPSVDSGRPELLESLPPNGRPVYDVWDAQVAFVDQLSGALDPLDAGTVGAEDVRVEDEAGRLSRGWRPEAEPGSAFVRLYQPRGGFSPDWSSAKTYTVQLLGVPGATGIADVHGNAMEPQTFQALVQPTGNRVPMVRDLRDLGASASTSPAGRSLELEFGLRDADTQVVHVSVSIHVGGVDVPLPSYAADVFADPYGSGWYRFPQNSGGPPAGDSDAALAALPSGVYPVTITLDDGTDTTTYVRDVFMWSPADVPSLEGVDDGGTFRPMDALHPPVVENGPTPALRWRLANGASPDFLGVYLATLDGVGDQGGGSVEALVAPPDVASLTAPSPLATDVYLWTVVQQRFAAGTNDPRSAGWALDLRSPMGTLFVVGPHNRALDGREYGAARIAFESAAPGTLSGISDATGLWTFLPAGAAAPVFVSQAMTDETGTALPGAQNLFAYGAADAAFTVTEAAPGGPIPLLPTRGAMGRAGGIFAVAQGNESFPSLTAGAYRYATSGFGTSLEGRFAFVQLEAQSTAGVVQGAGGSVGTATFGGPGSTTVSVMLTQNDGSTPPAAMPVPYTLGDDGLLSLDVGQNAGTDFARGLVGGAPGEEIAALALDDQPAAADQRTFWLLMARARDWTGDETNGAIVGDYRFADLSVEMASGQQGAHGASGTLRFDGQGGFTFAVNTPGGVEVGAGTYAVDALAERVRVEVPKGDGSTRTLTFAVGPDFDTLLGMSTGDAGYAEVLIVTR